MNENNNNNLLLNQNNFIIYIDCNLQDQNIDETNLNNENYKLYNLQNNTIDIIYENDPSHNYSSKNAYDKSQSNISDIEKEGIAIENENINHKENNENSDNLFNEYIEECSDIEYECPIEDCKQTFLKDELLKEHLKNHSTNSNPVKKKYFICKICNNQFTRLYSLKVHTRLHTGEKPYKCTFDNCLKKFTTSGDLQRHIRVHTGYRPYKCTFNDTCKLEFSTKTNLQIHIRKHTGYRPYKCEIENCGKTFLQLNNYKNHQNIHTGKKPYKCDICQKYFSEYSTLYKHKKIHR